MTKSRGICRACGLQLPEWDSFCPVCTAPPPPVPPRPRSSSAAVDTSLERRWGGGQENPTIDEMRSALAELEVPDREHPSTWLGDEEDWTVDVYETGLVIFHCLQGPPGLGCERRGGTRDEALELWLLLQQGRRDEIRRKMTA
jgi:hypothetical protein